MKSAEFSAAEASDGGSERARPLVRHLYVHVPFCPHICPYCSFYKTAGDHRHADDYIDAVLAELAGHREAVDFALETVFIGGGTPTALRASQLERLAAGLQSLAGFERVAEWTIEMNPASVSRDKAESLRRRGVNRVSMGVQAWQPELLETLGRVHSAEQAAESYAILRAAGFDAINLDHIFGIPGQTASHWRQTLERTLDLAPEHVSAYCLTYERDTEFFRRFQSGRYRGDEDAEAEFFETAMGALEQAGYRHYEISNYALPGRECRHNLAYWNGADYLGLGPSAFSTVAGARWQNVPDSARYVAAIRGGRNPASFREAVDPETRRSERVAFGLRTGHGVPLDLIVGRDEQIVTLLEHGLAEIDGGRLVATRAGRLLVDSLAESLL